MDTDDSTYIYSMTDLDDSLRSSIICIFHLCYMITSLPLTNMLWMSWNVLSYLFLLSTGHLLDLSKICPVCLRSCAVKTYTIVTFLSVDQRCSHHSCILHQAVEQPTSHWQRPCRKYPSICWGVLHRPIDDSTQIRVNGNDKFSDKITSHRHRIVNFVNAVILTVHLYWPILMMRLPGSLRSAKRNVQKTCNILSHPIVHKWKMEHMSPLWDLKQKQ